MTTKSAGPSCKVQTAAQLGAVAYAGWVVLPLHQHQHHYQLGALAYACLVELLTQRHCCHLMQLSLQLDCHPLLLPSWQALKHHC